MTSKKILILRFSSFGDIIQTLATVDVLHEHKFKIDYFTKSEFKHCIEYHPNIQNKYYFSKKNSFFSELKKFRSIIKENNYDVIYDAHNNIRTHLLKLMTLDLRLLLNLKNKKVSWICRPKYRFKRLLYFKFKKRDVFQNPMIAAESFLRPLIENKVLRNSSISKELNQHYIQNILNSETQKNINLNKPFVVLAPSAAWPLKRWPTEYYQQLIQLKPNNNFVILGGPDDDFAKQIQGDNVLNLVGELNWVQTGQVIAQCHALVAADTGVLHWSDYMGRPTIGILGPTAFGQPFRTSTTVLNKKLACSPCSKDGRGHCKIPETQKCLKDITPQQVSDLLDKISPI